GVGYSLVQESARASVIDHSALLQVVLSVHDLTRHLRELRPFSERDLVQVSLLARVRHERAVFQQLVKERTEKKIATDRKSAPGAEFKFKPWVGWAPFSDKPIPGTFFADISPTRFRPRQPCSAAVLRGQSSQKVF